MRLCLHQSLLLLQRQLCQFHRRQYISSSNVLSPKVAIVGSGPAGFYTAQQILKGHPNACVDIYEKLPVPFGLVRFGVAPDHPEVKNCINSFTQTASNERCSFLGNVTVGKDVTVQQLQQAYTAVVLAYGAEGDKTFGIPGEDLPGVFAARSFVGWYNGLPMDRHVNPDLDTDTAMVLGQGNVALDVARILITPVDILRKTDITDYALEALSKSRIRRVYLVGRRGPLQVAFTTAELREMVKLQACRPVFRTEDFSGIQELIKEIGRPKKRLVELLMKSALNPSEEDQERWKEAQKEWAPLFLRSPIEILPSSNDHRVAGVRFAVNRLEGSVKDGQRAVATDETEDIPCGLVLRSIGYKSLPIEANVPFNSQQAVVANREGRVNGESGLYCSGWVKRGPVGVLASTMNDSFATGKVVVDDLNSGTLKVMPTHGGKQAVMNILKEKGVKVVKFEDWNKIDQVETDKGQAAGKPREKITDIQEMLQTVI